MPQTPKQWPKRFADKVSKRGPDECWPWIACTSGDYGQYWLNGRMHSAHRVALQLLGFIIPDDHVVLHSCDTPLCCNPSHLSHGPQLENMQDMVRKNRQGRGEKHGAALITEAGVRFARSADLPVKSIAAILGVSAACIYDIREGRSWAHVV